MPKKKTHDEFVAEVNKKNQYLTILGTYIGSKSKVKVRCCLCNKEYDTNPDTILKGNPCEECYSKIRAKAMTMTHKEFMEKLKLVNRNIEVVGEYIGSKTKIECRCLKCTTTFYPTPNSLLRGHGCPVCKAEAMIKIRTTNSEFLERLNVVNQNVEVLSDYVTSTQKIWCRCKSCGDKFEITPKSLLRGQGCVKCGHKRAGMKAIKEHDVFVAQMAEVNSDIIIKSHYCKSKEKITAECVRCGCVWKTTPNALLNEKGCPQCGTYLSKGEEKCSKYFDSHNVEYVKQKIFDDLVGSKGKPLRFDFFLPKYNVLIEYQGEQHERAVDFFGGQEKFEIQVYYDNLKRNFAKEHRYKLLEISFRDYNNIDIILDNYLKSK